MSIAVTSHIGRDLLQNAAYFNSAPKVVMEYVSNSIDNAPDGHSVTVEVSITNSEIVIADNASGMSQMDLIHFFTMHGINRQRRRGRKVRGRFGTGKSAAFGIADGLRVETIKDGLRNVVELHRGRILSVEDGSAIPVDHIVIDEPVEADNGTTVTIYDLQLDRIFITPVRERLERALGRHLDMHEVYINGRRLKYRRPDAVGVFTFDPPAEILARMPNTKPLQISVAREVLTPVENGIAVLSNGFLNAMTLGAAAGKPHVERIFGEVEVPDLDDERDDEHFPAFDNTRDLSLNIQNPRAALILEWIGNAAEQVRKELDIEAQLARLSEVNMQMQDAADFVSELINADFARVQRHLTVATQSAMKARSMGSSEVVEIEVERSVWQAPPESPQPTPVPLSFLPAQGETPAYPPINYDEPDAPDAVSVEFEAPPMPEVSEDTSPEEAYQTFVEYITALDQLEEKAYQEAVIAQAQEAIPQEERREVLREALFDVENYKVENYDPAPLMEYPPNANPHQPTDHYPREMVTEYHTQHVVSDHQVLVTPDAEQLQADATANGTPVYEDRWVVDRESFIAGGNPDAEMPSGNGKPLEPAKKLKKPTRRTYFHINFEHMGQDAPRSRFAEEGRTIYINRDHPQIVHIEDTEGVDSLAYRNLMNEIVIQEYASAVVKQMASTGFYVADPFDAIETIQAVVNRLALEAGQRMRGLENIEKTPPPPAKPSSLPEFDDDLIY